MGKSEIMCFKMDDELAVGKGWLKVNGKRMLVPLCKNHLLDYEKPTGAGV